MSLREGEMESKRSMPWLLTLCFLSILTAAGGTARADVITITLYSNQNNTYLTGASATNLGAGFDTSTTTPNLTAGILDLSGLTFGPVLGDIDHTNTNIPLGAPSGTDVVNLPGSLPGPTVLSNGLGASGYFEVTFTLPADFTDASLSGAAAADDGGFVFLNGHLLSSSLSEYTTTNFNTGIQSDFVSGTNELVIADNNSGGGPSGASFWATVTYAVPEPASLLALGISLIGLAPFRKRFRKS